MKIARVKPLDAILAQGRNGRRLDGGSSKQRLDVWPGQERDAAPRASHVADF